MSYTSSYTSRTSPPFDTTTSVAAGSPQVPPTRGPLHSAIDYRSPADFETQPYESDVRGIEARSFGPGPRNVRKSS